MLFLDSFTTLILNIRHGSAGPGRQPARVAFPNLTQRAAFPIPGQSHVSGNERKADCKFTRKKVGVAGGLP